MTDQEQQAVQILSQQLADAQLKVGQLYIELADALQKNNNLVAYARGLEEEVQRLTPSDEGPEEGGEKEDPEATDLQTEPAGE